METTAIRGFTLIEISIVLVIIGLIVGGVLVGQDLIHAAEVRSAIAQIEQYKTAVNTFRTKYNGLPGDLIASQAAALGFDHGDGSSGHGDGDGMLSGCSPSISDGSHLGCENVLFWQHLAAAGVITGPFATSAVGYGDGYVGAISTASAINNYYPRSEFGYGTNVAIGSGPEFTTGVLNYLQLAGIASWNGNNGWSLNLTITPADAANIDSKVDDGMPMTGDVVAAYNTLYFGWNFYTNGGWGFDNSPLGIPYCLEQNNSKPSYALGYNSSLNTPKCQLLFVLTRS